MKFVSFTDESFGMTWKNTSGDCKRYCSDCKM